MPQPLLAGALPGSGPGSELPPPGQQPRPPAGGDYHRTRLADAAPRGLEN